MSSRLPSWPMLCGLASLVAFGGGCVTEGRPIHQVPPPPAAASSDVFPTVIDVSASRFGQDSDKNGYADVVSVSVFLFNLEKHPASLHAAGQFIFELSGEDHKRIAQWTLTAAEVQACRRDLLPGPGYVFQLSIRDQATDEIPRTDAQLSVMYVPAAGGQALRSPNPIRVSIGKIR